MNEFVFENGKTINENDMLEKIGTKHLTSIKEKIEGCDEQEAKEIVSKELDNILLGMMLDSIELATNKDLFPYISAYIASEIGLDCDKDMARQVKEVLL